MILKLETKTQLSELKMYKKSRATTTTKNNIFVFQSKNEEVSQSVTVTVSKENPPRENLLQIKGFK